MCRFPLFIISMAHFSMPNSIPISRLYILKFCIRVSNSLTFFAKSLMSSMYIRWLIYSCDLVSLYPPVHFWSMWLSGIIAITNINGDSASLRKIPPLILTWAKLFLPAVNSTLQASTVFSINVKTSLNILYIFRQCIIQVWGTMSEALLSSIQAIARFFSFALLSLIDV